MKMQNVSAHLHEISFPLKKQFIALAVLIKLQSVPQNMYIYLATLIYNYLFLISIMDLLTAFLVSRMF